MPITQAPAKNGQSVMTELISRLNDRISSLETFTSRLESVGHRMKDTNVPPKPAGEMPVINGFLSEFENSLQVFGYLNDRLLALADKMEQIA